MKLVLIIVGILAFVVALVAIIGALLPRQHQASRSVVLPASPADVYRTLTDYASHPTWRKDVKRVEILDAVDGHTRFREHGPHGAVTYQVVREVPGRLLVTEIADRDLGYSGSWTYALTPEGNGTRLTITENGEVSNVIFRFMSRFVFGQTKTMETYLAALSEHMR